jgi:hypothetical protein
MPAPKYTPSKTSRISIKRNRGTFAITIEGGFALLVTGLAATAYFIHLFH